jgi:hypothetical protein
VTILVVVFFTLEWLKDHHRYEFLVKGDVCIAFDHKEEALKVIGVKGCISIPVTKTMEQQMREQIEAELAKKVQSGQLRKMPDDE